jgi:hypothetical protein
MITYDTTGGGADPDGGDGPLTYNLTIGSGENRILIVGVRLFSNLTSNPISSVTFNGVGLTKITDSTIGGNQFWLAIYYLVNPDSGTHAVSVNYPNGNNTYITSAAAAYSGADQVNPIDAFATKGLDSAGQTTMSHNVTTTVDNCWVFGFFYAAGGSISLTGATSRTVADTYTVCGDSNEPITPAGSKTMSYTFSSSTYVLMGLISFKPVSSSGASLGGAFLMQFV